MKSRNVMGIEKKLFIMWVEVCVFFKFLPEVLRGRLGLKRFVMFLKRLLYFLSKMKHNKFVKLGKDTRIDLYCPGFPSEAFYTACKKFMVFDRKLPCTTVLLSVTSACTYHCAHCYQKHDKGKDMDIDVLVSTVKKLQDMGIAFFNIEGGEPFLVFDRLLKVCRAIDGRSEIWVNSTGCGITLDRLQQLKMHNLTVIMFSLHSPDPESMNKFMGDDNAWQTMMNAISICHEAGIAVAFNSCLSKKDFYNGNFERIMDIARDKGAAIIQLIKPKPSGGWLEKGVEEFTQKDMDRIMELVNRYNLDEKYKEYPSISAQIIEESADQFGCTAGGTDRFYINAKGDMQPCEFLNISFGNVCTENFEEIYEKMRAAFNVPGECWLCEKYSGEVLRLLKENELKTLPLPCDLSEEMCSTWDRGNNTRLYEDIEKMR